LSRSPPGTRSLRDALPISPPGGDVIGRRRLDPHLDAFRALGGDVRFDRWYHLSAPGGLRPCDFFMDEPSVMGTENALMAAALTPDRKSTRLNSSHDQISYA